MLVLFLMNFAIVYTSILLTKSVFKLKNRIDNFLTVFLLYFTQIVLILEVLGIFRKLSLANVLGLVFLFFFGILCFIKIRNRSLSPLFSIKGVFDKIDFRIDDKVIKFCLAIIFGFGLVKIVINLFNPPFGWDCLNYHFTFPVEWLKNHNLESPISISGDPSVSYYPINGSLFFLWFILPLKNVFLADLGQVPFFIAAFFAVISIGRKLGLSGERSFFAAILFSLIPNYFKQLQIAYIDIIIAALFLIALNYLFLISREGKIKNIILCSLAIGLTVGTKTTAMPTILLLMLPLVYLCMAKNSGVKRIFALVSCLFTILITGGYSYIKDLILTNNPLYPLNFRIFNFTIFKGVIDNAMYRTNIMPGDFKITKLLFHEGLGGQTLLFVLPAIVLACPLLFFKNRKINGFLMNYLLVLPLLIILVFRFVIPLANIRYIYAMFAISILIFFYAADVFKIPGKFIKVLVILCVVASIPELAKKSELVAGLLFSAVIFISLGFIMNLLKGSLKIKVFVIVCSVFIGLIFIEKYYVKNEMPRYSKMVKYSGFWPDAAKAWDWLNNNTTGNNIAYIGRPVGLPLYGTNFKNNVYYVSVNKVEPAMLHYFPNSKYIHGYKGKVLFRNFESPENYRGNASYDVWLSNLRKKEIDFLFIYSDLLGRGIEFPMENAWAESHPETFSLVFKNETIRIYKLIK
jgi:hypothetical protein